MADFDVKVYKIEEPVIDHPNADRLSIIKILGYTCIANKDENGAHRYKIGDLVVYIPENALLPEWLLKEMGFWDEQKQKGTLHGSGGNRVKAVRLRGIFSEGLLYPVNVGLKFEPENETEMVDVPGYWINTWTGTDDEALCQVFEDEDVGKYLGVVKYEPRVPQNMTGRMSGAYISQSLKYDFDNLKKLSNMFDPVDEVYVSEKLHGTLMDICYCPGVNDEKLFGENHNIFVTSKGVGARGFILENTPDNSDNLYVNHLKGLLENGLEKRLSLVEKLVKYTSDVPVETFHMFGEIFGPGVQDLTYGLKKPEVRFFDIAINKKFVDYAEFLLYTKLLKVAVVPELYIGNYDLSKILPLVSGKDTLSGTHIREGIVIKTLTEQYHPRHGRKIGKMISEEYLLRKSGTEYQ